MKIKAEAIPYSSMVGTGVAVMDDKGKNLFILPIAGLTFDLQPMSAAQDDVKKHLEHIAKEVARILDGEEMDLVGIKHKQPTE